MIGFLLMMQLSTALVVESIQINEQDQNTVSVEILLRNKSPKTITGFSISQRTGVSNILDELTEDLPAGQTYRHKFLKLPNQALEVKVLGIVFADESTEGEGSVLLAGREGRRAAEDDTAKQVREFLKFNSVLDDAAMAVLDRELEQETPAPSRWKTNKEKFSWFYSYQSTRKSARQKLGELKEHGHRQQRLQEITGGAR